MNDVLMGLLIVLVFVGVPLTIGCIAARRLVLMNEEGESPAPPVRRRRPVISRPLRPDAPARPHLLAPLVRTASQALHRISTPTHAGAPGATVPGTRADDLPHSPEELYQLTQAILHKQRGLGKAEAIQRAFGVSKGGNPKYQRLSRMFDLATEPPTPYRPLSEEQRRAREALGLERA